ncbi:aldo/keto reductase [Rubritalea tangerina]|uniref:Aldo/keto reductase n=1 Tax=Rubritalea tangerina TaxID=430798 RepID=A0ABW4ZAS8_9BACT
MRLVTGTAQLGLDYGVANESGMPDIHRALEIVEQSFRNGINCFDTAKCYGEAESVLGECFSMLSSDYVREASVITKIATLGSREEIDSQIQDSIDKLQLAKLAGVMLHSPSELYEADEAVLEHFFNLTNSGSVGKVGVSVYTVDEAELAVEKFGAKIIQVPSNLFDRSFVDAGFFQKCRERGVRVYVRSLFLQGLFFLPLTSPQLKGIPGAHQALVLLHAFCERHACSIQELCFADAARFMEGDLVIGAEKPEQLLKNIDFAKKAENRLDIAEAWKSELNKLGPVLVDPRKWR